MASICWVNPKRPTSSAIAWLKSGAPDREIPDARVCLDRDQRITERRAGSKLHFAFASSHHHSRGSGFFSGQIWSSVSPSNSSPFFMT